MILGSISEDVAPRIEHPALVPRLAERVKARFEQGEDHRLHAAYGKIPRLQEHMVEEGRARSAAANDKNRRLVAISFQRCGSEISRRPARA